MLSGRQVFWSSVTCAKKESYWQCSGCLQEKYRKVGLVPWSLVRDKMPIIILEAHGWGSGHPMSPRHLSQWFFGNDNFVFTLVMKMSALLWQWQFRLYFDNTNVAFTLAMTMKFLLWQWQCNHYFGNYNVVLLWQWQCHLYFGNDNVVFIFSITVQYCLYFGEKNVVFIFARTLLSLLWQ